MDIYDEIDAVLKVLLDKLFSGEQDVIGIDTLNAGGVAEILIRYDFDVLRSGEFRLNFKTENLDYTTKVEEFNSKIYLTVNGKIVNILRI